MNYRLSRCFTKARISWDFCHDTAWVERRFPDEPYRQRLGAIGERLRATRAYLTERPGPVAGTVRVPRRPHHGARRARRRARPRTGLDRVAWGELQDLRWQVETFGFHLASLEVRQHADVHAVALRALAAGGRATPSASSVALAIRGDPRRHVAEVLATFRAIAAIQRRSGERGVSQGRGELHDIARRRPRGARPRRPRRRPRDPHDGDRRPPRRRRPRSTSSRSSSPPRR